MTTTKHDLSPSKWTVEQWVEHGREWLAAGWTWSAGQVAIASWPSTASCPGSACSIDHRREAA